MLFYLDISDSRFYSPLELIFNIFICSFYMAEANAAKNTLYITPMISVLET